MAARNYGPAQDGLLAMISVLSVMFLVLFVSCAYFLSLRSQIQAQDEATMAEFAQMQQAVPVQGNVAGYETEYGYEDYSEVEQDYVPEYVDLEEELN